MQLSTGFALALFLILITGGGGGMLRLAGIRRGSAAALLLLITVLSTVTKQIGGLFLHPASLILSGTVLLLSRKEHEAAAQALLTAAFGGILGFLLRCLFRATPEQGLILMIPGLLALLFPGTSTRGSLYGALLAPFAAGLWLSLEESCLFERFYLELGGPAQLDAALATVLIAGCCRGVFYRFSHAVPRFFPLKTENGEQD